MNSVPANMNKKKGFTLIELLVVIAIIGVLSSVVLASLNTARGRANDARRISDLKAIEIALALYYDNNGAYPIVNDPGIWGGGVLSTRPLWSGVGGLGAALVPSFISSLPVDPINGRSFLFNLDVHPPPPQYGYYYNSDGQIYDLVAWFEQPNALDCSNNNYYFDTWGNDGILWCGNDFNAFKVEARIYEVNDNQ